MKLSVIVPVYNTVQYLQQCIESIIRQTYKDIEIILVDDGSTDGSEEICDQYAESYNNIKVIHQKNGGNVSARCCGAGEAAGEYVTFMDSDDWIEEDMYELLMDTAKTEECDIVSQSGYTGCEGRQYYLVEDSTMFGTYKTGKNYNVFLSKMMYDEDKNCRGICPSLGNKVIKREVMDKVVARVDKNIVLGGDAALFYSCCIRAESICIVKGYQYHYRMREMSVCHSYDIKYFSKVYILYQYFKDDFSVFEERDKLLRQVKKYLWDILSVQINQIFGLEFKNVYLFPYQCINKGSKIILYGAGKVGQSYYEQIRKNEYCDIVAWVDRNAYKENEDIIPLTEIVGLKYSQIVIGIKSKEIADEIINDLIMSNVDKEKIVWEEPYVMSLL